jgi:hypothetical protein
MSFWEQHAQAEAAHAEAERAKLTPSAQNAPAECHECGHFGPDVMFGNCLTCFEDGGS